MKLPYILLFVLVVCAWLWSADAVFEPLWRATLGATHTGLAEIGQGR